MNKKNILLTTISGLVLHSAMISLLAEELSPAGKTGPTFDVRDFGATGNGQILDTQAIQKAIDACAKSGGGTVLITAGTYLSGTIYMKSNITLHITAGATLLGSTNLADYPRNKPKFESYNDAFQTQSLIYGENLQNIAVVGRGTIDGQGSSFKVVTRVKPDRYKNRPFNLWFITCKNVLVENLTLRNSARWMQHYLACDDVTIRGVNVYNHCNLNNDMIDIDGCRNVLISDCFGDTDDDGITLKSTSGRITENVTITNCVISSHVNAIKMGTESHGGFKNITISNIVVKPSAHDTFIYGVPHGIGGITLGMVDGGILENVVISNILIDGAETPIFMRLGNRGRTYKEGQDKPPVGIFRKVKISNVIATGASDNGCSITGIPGHPIEDISLNNVKIVFKGGGTFEDGLKVVEENEEGYPGSRIFGKLPSYGFFVRHAKNVRLDNIDLSFDQEDARPALFFDDVEGLDISGLQAEGSPKSDALIRLRNSQEVHIFNFKPVSAISTFLAIEGEGTKNVKLFGNDLTRTENILRFSQGAIQDEVKLLGNFER